MCTLAIEYSNACGTMGEVFIQTSYFPTVSIVMGDINPCDNESMTPLHCAAQFGRHKHIALLNQGTLLYAHMHAHY